MIYQANISCPTRLEHFMHIAITGASGFVGQQLVPLLESANVEVLLAGRNVSELARLFPGRAVCDYASLECRAMGCDILVNLAVLNNDSNAELGAFRKVNVDFLLELYRVAGGCGMAHFIDVSSIRAFDPNDTTAYAVSKREGSAALSALTGPAVTTLYLPTLYRDVWSGKMAVLNYLPARTARRLFVIFAALKPTLDIARIAQFIICGDYQSEVILTDGQRNNSVFRFFKRSLDLGFAIAVVLALGWLMLIIWLIIRSTSKGPGIFSQARVGRNGFAFTCYKFRTMELGTAQLGTHEISTSSVTAVGAILRRTKLDELPQVWNILLNQMSLVGPRPCLPIQGQLVEARRREGVLSMTPGITGLAQVNAVDMRDPEKLARWDSRYLKLQSLMLDLKIILATAMGGGSGDRVRAATQSHDEN